MMDSPATARDVQMWALLVIAATLGDQPVWFAVFAFASMATAFFSKSPDGAQRRHP